ncbi:hypothetical protein OHA98_16205 [Streptomyces sp. NBC_00654]|uniref:hypothetical protein n=1 Tax=Streptomyces sp. NBC_00654 TaxID=2975799 RepID=UPI002256BF48|nr:hypothetical protein [Streptomyces sp. NBC_00654]MCX4966351.1 hypothetical protein [Streptomyces sp. NBC_00654]
MAEKNDRLGENEEDAPHWPRGRPETIAVCGSVRTAAAPTRCGIYDTCRVTPSAYEVTSRQEEIEASEDFSEPMHSTAFQVMFRAEKFFKPFESFSILPGAWGT